MAAPYTVIPIVDVPLSETSNIMEGQTGRVLENPSRIRIALNRETVAITYDIFVGAKRVLVRGAAAVNATAGDVPILPDDVVIDTFGDAQDEIVINANNSDGAAAREARAIVQVTEVDDAALQAGMANLAGSGFGVA